MKYLILTIFLFVTSHSYTQKSDYLFLNSEDTLKGTTRIPISFGKKVFYYDVFIVLEGDSVEQKFHAKEIKSYTNSGDLYISNGHQIMKRIIDGRIILYDCFVERNSIDISTYVQKNISNPSGKGLYRGYCMNKNSKLPYSIEKLDFKRNGFELFKENTELDEESFYNRYSYKDIPTIVKEYNLIFEKYNN